MTALFGTHEETPEEVAGKVFGERYRGRYHLPLLPGEAGVKRDPRTGKPGDWVPRGVQSATNLAGAIVDTRELGIWETERVQIGLALRPDLAERMAFAVHQAERQIQSEGDERARSLTQPGVKLKDHAPLLKAELGLIAQEAKRAAGGDAASQQGTNRHDVWEARAPGQQQGGLLFGTPQINKQAGALERLLADNHLERVPGLQERTVRNVSLNAAGRFDDILRDTRTGTLFLADLKTRRDRTFYSYLEVRIQMAVYATAEWMLDGSFTIDPITGMGRGGSYVPGPKHHVSQAWGILLHMPAGGDEPRLVPVNLVKGYAHALIARQVVDMRSEAKNVAAHAEADWETFVATGGLTT